MRKVKKIVASYFAKFLFKESCELNDQDCERELEKKIREGLEHKGVKLKSISIIREGTNYVDKYRFSIYKIYIDIVFETNYEEEEKDEFDLFLDVTLVTKEVFYEIAEDVLLFHVVGKKEEVL